MNNIEVNINTGALVRHTARLERMHRSALPVAVRGALNSVAFDMKKETLLKSAKDAFVQRKPSFFKANSKVEKAAGLDLTAMKATVGFVGASQAVEDLEKQEAGGSIGGRAFIPLNTARVSKSAKKSVRPINRISAIGNRVIDASKVRASSDKQRFIRAAYKAATLWGGTGHVLGNKRNGGRRTLSRIDEIWGSTRGRGASSSRELKIVRTPLYDVKGGRSVRVDRKDFAKRAARESQLRMPVFYEQQMRRQIQRLGNR